MTTSVIRLHPAMGLGERARWIAFTAACVTGRRRNALRDHVVESGYPVAVFDSTVDDVLEMRKAAANLETRYSRQHPVQKNKVWWVLGQP